MKKKSRLFVLRQYWFCLIVASILSLMIANPIFSKLAPSKIPFNDQLTTSPIDTNLILQSLTKQNELYIINYYGDYKQLLVEINRQFKNKNSDLLRYSCSIFTAIGNPDQPIYGKNFDNPECSVLLGYYYPSNGYSSIAFSRMNDFGFDKEEDPTQMSNEQRIRLLDAPFFAADGMNECGVAAALTHVRSQATTVEPNKESIFITYLIRKILDQAGSVDEAINVLKQHNVFDSDIGTLSHHLLIADASPKSVIAEYKDGEWHFIANNQPWQVLTNSCIYNIPLEERKHKCWRYKTAHTKLCNTKGKINYSQGMNILMDVSVKNTQWSTIADLKQRKVYLSLFTGSNIMRFKLMPNHLIQAN